MSQARFWDKPAEAQATINQLKTLKRAIDPWKKAHTEASDLSMSSRVLSIKMKKL